MNKLSPIINIHDIPKYKVRKISKDVIDWCYDNLEIIKDKPDLLVYYTKNTGALKPDNWKHGPAGLYSYEKNKIYITTFARVKRKVTLKYFIGLLIHEFIHSQQSNERHEEYDWSTVKEYRDHDMEVEAVKYERELRSEVSKYICKKH